jgi:restriction-modification enzyme MmeI-like protein
MHVLTAVLGYTPRLIAEGQTLPAGLETKIPEMGETLRPDFALVGVGSDTAGQAQLLIASHPAEQALDKPVIGKHWKATPATRMMELLHGTGVSLGLVTNGEHWMLVYAPRGETTGYASWYGALWLDEPITLRAFHSLFGVRRFFGVAADSTLLATLKESANDQQEVTDQLGYQVREAVEVLVRSVLLLIDHEQGHDPAVGCKSHSTL